LSAFQKSRTSPSVPALSLRPQTARMAWWPRKSLSLEPSRILLDLFSATSSSSRYKTSFFPPLVTSIQEMNSHIQDLLSFLCLCQILSLFVSKLSLIGTADSVPYLGWGCQGRPPYLTSTSNCSVSAAIIFSISWPTSSSVRVRSSAWKTNRKVRLLRPSLRFVSS